MHFSSAQRNRGFTLIEMIAAFVIFAIAIGSLMQILTLAMNSTRRSFDETRAALWAQSLLDNVGVGERIEAGNSSGKFDDDFHWSMQVEQIDPELVEAETTTTTSMGAVDTVNPGNTAAGPAAVVEIPTIELYHVQLDVIWGDRARERSARFTTLRTAAPELGQGVDMPGIGGRRSGRDGGKQIAPSSALGRPAASSRQDPARRAQ